MGHETTKLEESPPETWGNTILWKLADALGRERDAHGGFTVDADELLEEALEIIWRYQDMADS